MISPIMLSLAAGNHAAATTFYRRPTACFNSEGASMQTESNVETVQRVAGTYARLWIRVTSNDRGSTTVRTRVNAANGAQSLTVGASATGLFEDTTNADTIAAGDDVAISIAVGSGGASFIAPVSGLTFSPTDASKTVSKLGTFTSSPAITGASATFYWTICGDATSILTTEAHAQFSLRTAGTLKNAHAYVSANARVTTTTIVSRVSAADGALTLSIGAGATGLFEDTSNSDAVVSGDEINWKVTTGTGTQSLTVQHVGMDLETTTGICVMVGRRQGSSVSALTTRYSAANGWLGYETAEATVQQQVTVPGVASDLSAYVITNGITGTTTINFRKNGANGNQSLSIGASATGFFEDASNSDVLALTDLINYRIVGGNSGGGITPGVVGVHFEEQAIERGLGGFRQFRDVSQAARLRRHVPSFNSSLIGKVA